MLLDIFSDTLNALQSIYNAVTGGILDGISQAVTGLVNLPGAVAGIVTSLLGGVADVITYPIIAILTGILTIANTVIAPVAGLAGNIIATGVTITGTITTVLGAVWDASWMALILAGVAFVIAVRVYHYLKDIEILGNKV